MNPQSSASGCSQTSIRASLMLLVPRQTTTMAFVRRSRTMKSGGLWMVASDLVTIGSEVNMVKRMSSLWMPLAATVRGERLTWCYRRRWARRSGWTHHWRSRWWCPCRSSSEGSEWRPEYFCYHKYQSPTEHSEKLSSTEADPFRPGIDRGWEELSAHGVLTAQERTYLSEGGVDDGIDQLISWQLHQLLAEWSQKSYQKVHHPIMTHNEICSFEYFKISGGITTSLSSSIFGATSWTFS